MNKFKKGEKMKFLKVGIIGVLLCLSNAYADKSGFFIGVDVGVLANSAKIKDANGVEKHSAMDSTIGFKVGYNAYFNATQGIRITAFYRNEWFDPFHKNIVFYDLEDEDQKGSFLFGGIVDYLVNFTPGPSPFGLFFGVGYQTFVGKFKTNLQNYQAQGYDIATSGIFVNAGLSKIFNESHRIDLTVKVPISGNRYLSGTANQTDRLYQTLGSLTLGYAYTF